MIQKLALQSFFGYEGRRIRGIGRPQKVDRQEIVGAVTAVRSRMTIDHETRLAQAKQECQTIIAPLREIPGVTMKLINNVVGHLAYEVTLRVDPAVAGITMHDVVDRLKAGDPSIWTRAREDQDWIEIHVFGLNEGEDAIVEELLAALFPR